MFKKGIISYTQPVVLPEHPSAMDDGNTVAWYASNELKSVIKDDLGYVSRWNDMYGSGHDLVQLSVDYPFPQPLWSSEGIYFDGISNFMTGQYEVVQPAEIYMVVNQMTFKQYSTFITMNAGTIMNNEVTPSVAVNVTEYPVIFQSIKLAENTLGIIRAVLATDGKLQINANAAVYGTLGSQNYQTNVVMGNTIGYNSFSNILVYEIIIRKVADNPTDELAIYTYLKDKYAL